MYHHYWWIIPNPSSLLIDFKNFILNYIYFVYQLLIISFIFRLTLCQLLSGSVGWSTTQVTLIYVLTKRFLKSFFSLNFCFYLNWSFLTFFLKNSFLICVHHTSVVMSFHYCLSFVNKNCSKWCWQILNT